MQNDVTISIKVDYNQTIEYLFNSMPSFQVVGDRGYKPGLERIINFVKELGDPHLKYPTIHLAGSNGKGSTSHLIASILQSAGYRVGLFTSPHLRDFRERIRISGEMIGEGEVVAFVERHRAAMEREDLSFFEMTAAMAFDHFAREGVDFAIIECGLGGRLDGTNIVDPLLSIITNIAIEHTKYLGTTLTEISREKCGIIKPKRPIIIGERGAELESVARAAAERCGSEIIFAQDRYTYINRELLPSSQKITIEGDVRRREVELDLRGIYQRHNLITATVAIELLGEKYGIEISERAYLEGAASASAATSLAGRWQRLALEPQVVCDTAHNSHGIAQVARQLEAESYEQLYCVLGLANDKNADEILALFPRESYFIFTRASIERALPVEQLAEVASKLGLRFECVERVADAVTRAKELAKNSDLIFIGGSNFVVAEII